MENHSFAGRRQQQQQQNSTADAKWKLLCRL